MVISINKSVTTEQVDEQLLTLKPKKVLHVAKHLGKVKWEEDALAYQKRKRDEWN